MRKDAESPPGLHRAVRTPPRLAFAIAVALLCAGSGSAAEDAAPEHPSRDIGDLDLDELVKVRVSPFDISPALDRGYLASNSVSASRLARGKTFPGCPTTGTPRPSPTIGTATPTTSLRAST